MSKHMIWNILNWTIKSCFYTKIHVMITHVIVWVIIEYTWTNVGKYHSYCTEYFYVHSCSPIVITSNLCSWLCTAYSQKLLIDILNSMRIILHFSGFKILKKDRLVKPNLQDFAQLPTYLHWVIWLYCTL